MSHVPVETVEEDAADLQFPKAVTDDEQNLCDICHIVLNELYIACAECKCFDPPKSQYRQFRICLKCFACGAENANHSNAHNYIIVHNFVKVFPHTTWSAPEECALIKQIERNGFGNWSDISRALTKYSEKECQEHFIRNYFDGIFWKTCKLTRFPYIRIETPYLYHTKSFDPPRCKFDLVQNKYATDYRFARSDFDTPFDSSAEGVISDVQMNVDDTDWDNESQELSKQLNCALVGAYNNRLRERHRRHRIVRRHGLILPNRTRSWLAKYTRALCVKNGTENRMHTGRFVAFMQLLTGTEFDRIVEGLQYEVDLRKFIIKLYELRANGITTCYGGQIYQNMKIARSNKTASSKQQSLDIDWKYLTENDTLTGTEQILKHCIDLNQLPKKRKSTPLNIIGLTNYDKLKKDEQELCSTIRIVPNAYLTYKQLLIGENQKMGYLRLADARKLIKIDVNKTRVLYDFLFDHGYVNKPTHK